MSTTRKSIHINNMEEVTLEETKTLKLAPLDIILTGDDGSKYQVYEGIKRLFKLKLKENEQ